MSRQISPARAGADPAISARLMLATNVAAALGIFLGWWGLFSEPPTLRWGSALAVGVTGVLSFVRHSVFHRSDAARMGWDLGVRDNFQIEVGIANLAWGLVALASAVGGWGLRVDAAMCLTMGCYLAAVTVMMAAFPGDQSRRDRGQMIGIGSFGVALLALGGYALVLS